MIEGRAIVRFGTGDVLVTTIVKTNLSNGCIVLQNEGTNVVGECTQDFEKGEEDTVISFDNIKSLEVVIECLETLKEMMKGNMSGCHSEIKYDF